MDTNECYIATKEELEKAKIRPLPASGVEHEPIGYFADLWGLSKARFVNAARGIPTWPKTADVQVENGMPVYPVLHCLEAMKGYLLNKITTTPSIPLAAGVTAHAPAGFTISDSLPEGYVPLNASAPSQASKIKLIPSRDEVMNDVYRALSRISDADLGAYGISIKREAGSNMWIRDALVTALQRAGRDKPAAKLAAWNGEGAGVPVSICASTLFELNRLLQPRDDAE